MLWWLFALLLIPFLDAVLLAAIAWRTGYFGLVGMVAIVVLTGLVGLLFVRAEGRRTLRKMQRTLADGRPPTDELLDGALLIAAGAFLLTPGLVTDLLGFLLVVPLTRVPIRMAIKRWVVLPYLDRKTDGLASGSVWTFGFPDAGPRGPGEAGDDAVDLGRNEYTVDADGEEGYTIEFGDEPRTGASGADESEPGDETDAEDRDDDGR